MTIPFIVLLAVIAVVLRWLKWRRLSRALAVTATVLFLVIGYGLLAKPMLDGLQNGFGTQVEKWGQHNAIILLGGGLEKTRQGTIETGLFSNARVLRAAELHHACKMQAADCRIIPSGGDPLRYNTAEAQVLADDLYRLGVPREDVIIENRSLNTWQNAQFTAPFFANNRFDSAYLVSAGTHLRRSLIYFAHFGIHPQAVRADYARSDPMLLPTSFNFLVTDVALHEYIGIVRYYVYNALGWNVKPADKPGVS